MKVTGIKHVSVNCGGMPVEEMTAFYRDLFGLDNRERPDVPGIEGHWCDLGGLELHLVGAPPRGTPIDITGNHFCFAVENLDEAIDELERHGVPFERALQGEGTVQIWINDPGGNTIELQQDTRNGPGAQTGAG